MRVKFLARLKAAVNQSAENSNKHESRAMAYGYGSECRHERRQ